MVNVGEIDRAKVPDALTDLADLVEENAPLGSMLMAAYSLFDRVGAHDAFYVVLARAQDAPLLTTDAALARAARSLGVGVLDHDTDP